MVLILAVLGLIGTLVSSEGAILNADKVEALKQVGYFYVLFEVAASLACISAVVERRWWIAAGSHVCWRWTCWSGFAFSLS